MERRMVRLYGIVQEVNFRQSAKREAEGLGVAGFARNERNGSLTIVAEGEEGAVAEFLAWCAEGPPAARVIRVEHVATEAPEGLTGFTVEA